MHCFEHPLNLSFNDMIRHVLSLYRVNFFCNYTYDNVLPEIEFFTW